MAHGLQSWQHVLLSWFLKLTLVRKHFKPATLFLFVAVSVMSVGVTVIIPVPPHPCHHPKDVGNTLSLFLYRVRSMLMKIVLSLQMSLGRLCSQLVTRPQMK